MQWQALGALGAGLGFFVGLYGVAAYIDKPSKVPFVSRRCGRVEFLLHGSEQSSCWRARSEGVPVPAMRPLLVSVFSSHMLHRSLQAPREYPYDNLKVELARK